MVRPVFLGKLRQHRVPGGEGASETLGERVASGRIRTGKEIKMRAIVQNGCRAWDRPVSEGMTRAEPYYVKLPWVV